MKMNDSTKHNTRIRMEDYNDHIHAPLRRVLNRLKQKKKRYPTTTCNFLWKIN